MNKAIAEWVSVSEDVAIVARETGEFWFFDLNEHREMTPFTTPMTGKGTRGSTAALLNGAVALGFADDGGDLKQEAPSLPRYVLDLVGSYHNARRAPGHFSKAAKRLRELNRPDIASYLETHAREETGHDRLALKDLRALGLPAERIVANLIPEGWQPLYEIFDRVSSSDNPVGCIGYCYCFESTAAWKQKPEIKALQALCPEGVDASRFARTHSGLGSEAGHVEDLIDLIASLPASDRIEIVKVTYDTAQALAGNVRYDDLMSDGAIVAGIQAAAGQEIHLAA
jgi:hypothetical protein